MKKLSAAALLLGSATMLSMGWTVPQPKAV